MKKRPIQRRKPTRNKRVRQAWFVYMLECRGGKIYTGITPNVVVRFEKHLKGKGAAYTRINPPQRVLASKRCGSMSKAAKTESRLKKLRRPDKLIWARTYCWTGN